MLVSILWESGASTLFDDCFVALDQLFEVSSCKLIVEFNTSFAADLLEDRFEWAVVVFVDRLNAHDDIAIHLDEATIAIVSECWVARFFSECLNCLVVETKVQNGIHHARHGLASAGANGEKERVLFRAELFANFLFDHSNRSFHFSCECLRIFATVVVKVRADLGGDCEAWRHRQTNAGHLSEIGTLTTQKFPEFGATISFLTEVVAVFNCLRDCALGYFFCDFFCFFSWHKKRPNLDRVDC